MTLPTTWSRTQARIAERRRERTEQVPLVLSREEKRKMPGMPPRTARKPLYRMYMVSQHVRSKPVACNRLLLGACLIATLPLVHNCSRESPTAAPPSDAATTPKNVVIPDLIDIPSFQEKLVKTGAHRRTGETYARYELGRVFPADEFIAAVRMHLAKFGWLELDYSPVEPAASRYNRNRWYTIPPGQRIDLCFDAWWSHEEELVQLFLAREANPENPRVFQFLG